MSRFYYDFHLHSCLSPCGDNDMTPNNIVRMAKLKGLDVIALTDHNTCSNCASAVKAGERAGILVLPGMELCTREEIHCVCLFVSLDGAMQFASEIRRKLPEIKNRPDIFGDQLILDENDETIGTEEILLINAADVGINQVMPLAGEFGGAAFPAHVDKEANSVLAILGAIPAEADFHAVELSAQCDARAFLEKNRELAAYSLVRNSDAHYLWQISERENRLELEELTRESIIRSFRQ